MLTGVDIRGRVTYHDPSTEGKDRHAKLSAGFESLMSLVNDIVPDGREKSLVMTKLEEGKMWASAGVVRLYRLSPLG